MKKFEFIVCWAVTTTLIASGAYLIGRFGLILGCWMIVLGTVFMSIAPSLLVRHRQ